MQAKLSTMFQSLQVRNYRLFATGQLIKLIGVWMMFIAQDWLVLELSDNSATALGVVTALQFTPVLLLTLLSGRLADRYDKRMLLFVANAFWTRAGARHEPAGPHRPGAALARLRVRRAARHRQRGGDPGPAGVRLRTGRHAAAAQRALAERGRVQLRPDRRPGRRRPGHRRLRRRPGLPVHRAQLIAPLVNVVRMRTGRAAPQATCCRSASGTRPGSSTGCATSGSGPTCCCRWWSCR